MISLLMVLGKEVVVVYMVVLIFQGEIMKNYLKIYKWYGDVFKCCEYLNYVIKSDDYCWKLMCVKGWYDVDLNDKGDQIWMLKYQYGLYKWFVRLWVMQMSWKQCGKVICWLW